jgi:hypothetical protein
MVSLSIFRAQVQAKLDGTIGNWLRKKLKLLIIMVLLLVVLSLPIYPGTSVETLPLDIPYIEGQNNRPPDHAINIWTYDPCSYLILPDDLERITIADYQTVYQTTSFLPTKPKAVYQAFGGFDIGIYGISGCTECLDLDSLSIGDSRKCLMNRTSVLGFFERCDVERSSNYHKYDCSRIPFMVSDGLELISPDHEYKISIKPYVIAQKTQNDFNTIRTDQRYSLDLIVTYPDYKPLPYRRWILLAVLFVVDPLKSVVSYFYQRWMY